MRGEGRGKKVSGNGLITIWLASADSFEFPPVSKKMYFVGASQLKNEHLGEIPCIVKDNQFNMFLS